MNTTAWLPPLVLLEGCGGDWSRYVATLYSYFRRDFIDRFPVLLGKPVGIFRNPIYDGKEETFWHIISENDPAGERFPDMRRCERICWPRAVIENISDAGILVWEKTTFKNETRICLWIEDSDYLVILVKTSTRYLLLTAFPIRERNKAKIREEYRRAKKGDAAP